MNDVLSLVVQNWHRWSGQPAATMVDISCLLLTPRFETSRNVVFLFFSNLSESPVLVGKMPRVPGDDADLIKENENLLSIHDATNNRMQSMPRSVAVEQCGGNTLFLQTGLSGTLMSPAYVRSRTQWCIDAVTTWISNLHAATVTDCVSGLFEQEIQRPIEMFRRFFPLTAMQDRVMSVCEHALLAHSQQIPHVFEHGDLSHPNIFVLQDGGIGVVDWELAKRYGVPALDLFFVLSYLSAAISDAHDTEQHVLAFQRAFMGPSAWAQRYIAGYTSVMQLRPDLLVPLFVLCWTRYVVNRTIRAAAASGSKLPDKRVMDWVRSDRYYAYWRHAVDRIDELAWMTSCTYPH